ncbi:MAG: carbonic anhydrase [Rhodopirellula sp.]|nr:carbonic anhydrase [Rhodopirellula sp.]
MHRRFFLVLAAVLIASRCGATAIAEEAILTAGDARKKLEEGNQRFVSGKAIHPDLDRHRLDETAAHGQHPFATVIACSDSRVPPELLFDQGIGDLFVIRVAGNVFGVDEVASAEYGIEHLHTPVLVILGHTHCGAVEATTAGGTAHGSIPALLERIRPVVAKVKHDHPDYQGERFNEAVVDENVYKSLHDLLHQSEIARQLIQSGKLLILPAKYDIATGRVQWLGHGQ